MTLADKMNKVEAMRNHFFYKTLQYAEQESSFYRHLYRKIELTTDNYESDLAKLPIINKHIAMTNQNGIVCQPSEIVTHVKTSGTSRTGELMVFQSTEDYSSRKEFVGNAVGNNKRKILVMYLIDVFHGLPTPLSVPRVYAAYFDTRDFEAAARFLITVHEIPGVEHRVSRVMGSFETVKRFTKFLIKHKINPRATNIELLTVTGSYVAKKWKELLPRVWGSSLVDVYSLTEIAGNIVECRKCGNYHPHPFLISEVVSVESSKRITKGVGRLVLTSLYPFQKNFPLLRYDTQDLFEVRPRSCGEVSLYPRGRLAFSIYCKTGGQACLIPSGDVIDIIEDLPDVNRIVPFNQTYEGRYFDDLSWEEPAFFIETKKAHRRTSFKLHLELNYDPLLYQSECAGLESMFSEALCRKSGTFEEALSSGELEFGVEFHSPCSLPRSKLFLKNPISN